MHEYIRGQLEDLLAAESAASRLHGVIAKYDVTGVAKHLQSCSDCSSEVDSMKAQAALLRTLHAPEEEVEPTAGFYARVMQRIEDCTKDSIWSVFIYSPFGKRLAFASLAIAAVLSTYVVTLEARDGHLGGENLVAQQQLNGEAPCFGNPAQQRDAVLTNFASSQGSLQ
jgi:anti-sigma factor RsiW